MKRFSTALLILMCGHTFANSNTQNSEKLVINTTPKFIYCERNNEPKVYDVFIITTESVPGDLLYYRHIAPRELNLSWRKSDGAALGGSASGFDCNHKNLKQLLKDGQATY